MKPGQRAGIDMTSPGDSMEYVEVLTPAGIVRVGVGLIDTRTVQPVVLVEVEPNSRHQKRTPPGGHWNIETERRTFSERLDVRLIREEGT
jgi:hypothetical protein